MQQVDNILYLYMFAWHCSCSIQLIIGCSAKYVVLTKFLVVVVVSYVDMLVEQVFVVALVPHSVQY